VEIRAERTVPGGQQNTPKDAAQQEAQKIYVMKDGALSESFDPSIPSQTCRAAPKQMKVFDPSFTEADSNPFKKVFQDFNVNLKPADTKDLGVTALRLSVSAREDP
jgi:hypothetical protein